MAILVSVVLFLGLAGVRPARADFDTSAPVLHRLSIPPGPHATGDSFSVAWDATDEIRLLQVNVNLVDSAGKAHTVIGRDGSLSQVVQLTPAWANGQVSVRSVTVHDSNGNRAVYFPDGRLVQHPGDMSSHDVDLSGTFDKTGLEDITPPTLRSIELVAPGPFTAGDEVRVRWTGDGVTQAAIVFTDGAGRHQGFITSMSSSSASRVIDRGWASGPASLLGVALYDEWENVSYYRADGSVGRVPGGDGEHSIAFSALDFSTHDTGADATPPLLEALALRAPGPYAEGDRITLDWVASDDVGAPVVALEVKDAEGKGHSITTIDSGSGYLTIDSSWAVGPAELWYVAVYDQSGNSVFYYPDGSRESVPGGATTHDLNFDGLSFEVQGPDGGPTGGPTPDPTVEPTEEASSPPTVTLSHTPPGVSGPTASFGFVAVDPDTASEQLQVTCQLDGAVTPCGAGEATMSSLSDGSHTFLVTAVDPEGNLAQADHTWTVDAVAPTPATAAFSGPFTTALRAPVRWSATDAASGVGSFDVRYSSASPQGAWSNNSYPAGWQATTARTGPGPEMTPGRTYCFSTRARDQVGNRSAWSASRCLARPLDDRSLTAGRGWTRQASPGYFGGSALRTSAQGATLGYAGVKARRVGVLATTCASCGVVGVFLNGSLIGRVSLASPTIRHQQLLVLSGTGLRSGTISLRVLSSGKPVVVDGLVLSAV